MRPPYPLLLLAAMASCLSACNFYAPDPGGNVTFSPGYDYANNDDRTRDHDPDATHRPF